MRAARVCVRVCTHAACVCGAESALAPPVAGRARAEARPEPPVLSSPQSGLTHPAHPPLSSSSPSSHRSSPGTGRPSTDTGTECARAWGVRVQGPGSRPVPPPPPTLLRKQPGVHKPPSPLETLELLSGDVCPFSSALQRHPCGEEASGVSEGKNPGGSSSFGSPGDGGRAGVEEGQEQLGR